MLVMAIMLMVFIYSTVAAVKASNIFWICISGMGRVKYLYFLIGDRVENSIKGFNGERACLVSGAIPLGNGYRVYNPVLMRFNCPDSWSPFGGGDINSYIYCADDPVNRDAPSGHMSTGQWIGTGIGLLAGIALTIVTEGAALTAVLMLMGTIAGDAAIGAGAELITEVADRQCVNWGQVGIASGISAITTLVWYGMGNAIRLEGIFSRPFRGLMMEGAAGETLSTNMPKYYGPVSELVGRGGTASVYRIKPGILLKVYRNKQRPIELIRNEVNASIAVNGPQAAKAINSGIMMMRETEGIPLSDFNDLSWFDKQEQDALIDSVQTRLHSNGVVHRDLSPENIFVVKPGSTGPVKYNFIDFGFAKLRATEQEKIEEINEIKQRMRRWLSK